MGRMEEDDSGWRRIWRRMEEDESGWRGMKEDESAWMEKNRRG